MTIYFPWKGFGAGVRTITCRLMLRKQKRSFGDRSSVLVHGQDIKQVASYKYLGVHINSELKWHTHESSSPVPTLFEKTTIIWSE